MFNTSEDVWCIIINNKKKLAIRNLNEKKL
jgi:hypothetical protein